MHATLSFNGLLAGYPTLFDDLQVPAGVSKEAVCNQLLFDTLELEVLYADGPTMQRALGVFSETMLPSWTRQPWALTMTCWPPMIAPAPPSTRVTAPAPITAKM